MSAESSTFVCAKCSSVLTPGCPEGLVGLKLIFVVEPLGSDIDINMSAQEISDEIRRIIERLQGVSANEAQSDVADAHVVCLCRECRRQISEMLGIH